MNSKLGQQQATGQDPSPPTTRVIGVVELLARREGAPQTLAEISRELGITRSTGHAILHTLCKYDWAVRDPVSGRYALGPGLPGGGRSVAPAVQALHEPLERLCSAIGMAVCISEVRSGSIEVVYATAPGPARPTVATGARLPFVAPFGREFVAWAPARSREAWLRTTGPGNDAYRRRMPKVLNEIRRRGYGIERLSDPLVRVHAALLALDDGSSPDPVSVKVAGALADLTIVDVLPGELAAVADFPLATVSAPIFDVHGDVMMTISAQPYRRLPPDDVRRVGGQMQAFADEARSLLAGYDPVG